MVNPKITHRKNNNHFEVILHNPSQPLDIGESLLHPTEDHIIQHCFTYHYNYNRVFISICYNHNYYPWLAFLPFLFTWHTTTFHDGRLFGHRRQANRRVNAAPCDVRCVTSRSTTSSPGRSWRSASRGSRAVSEGEEVEVSWIKTWSWRKATDGLNGLFFYV